MKIKFYLSVFALCSTFFLQAQTIGMNWPAFAGKTYDFIIFQGDKQVIAQKDTIPTDGKFILTIPKEYAPYIGMCRWLITGTAEGGGLDMSIPGYDFSVECLEAVPNEKNIVFSGYDAMNELNRLSFEQSKIIEKHTTMLKALNLYDKKHKLYKKFDKERKLQEKEYEQFQKNLAINSNHGARFLPIVNIVNSIGTKLQANEEDKFKEITRFFAYDLDIDAFYTSGHWSGIIASFAQIHLHIVKDDKILYDQFSALTNRITNKKYYTDLTGKLTYYMKTYGMDKQVEVITPIVVNSNKITEYVGTMEVYIKALTGAQAPDLEIIEHLGKLEDHNHKTTILKSTDFASNDYTQTLLIFYQSGCGPCEELMQQLPQNYQMLTEKGVRIITISADEGEQVYKNASKDYPWKDKYCDFKGKEGVNFKNYAVKGTPNIYLINKSGKIEAKLATMDEILSVIK